MRLWHESLIPSLPDAQLRGQHRECAALRGLGWGRKHSTVDYVFTRSMAMLFNYHVKVIEEIKRRKLNYRIAHEWTLPLYRGKRCEPASQEFFMANHVDGGEFIYPEHNDAYLCECLENLRGKGIVIEGVE